MIALWSARCRPVALRAFGVSTFRYEASADPESDRKTSKGRGRPVGTGHPTPDEKAPIADAYSEVTILNASCGRVAPLNGDAPSDHHCRQHRGRSVTVDIAAEPAGRMAGGPVGGLLRLSGNCTGGVTVKRHGDYRHL